MKTKISLLGVSMHPLTMAETIEEIDKRIERAQFTQHVVVNVAKLVQMRRDERLRVAVEGCDIINIDGFGVVLGARLLGNEVPERVAGIDLFLRLLSYAERYQHPVFLLGADEQVLEKAVQNIRSTHPQLPIAGYHHGYFWGYEGALVKKIRESGAQLLFVGISSPKKEEFIHQFRSELGVLFAMGVGGSFDVVAGKVKRAPLWMQKAGFEWLFRLVQEPRRMFPRYFKTNMLFGLLLAKEAFTRWYYRIGGSRQS